MKLIVVGIDGASFELIDQWISQGRLPNIAKIKQHGVWANMRSVLPPVTSPNWKCYSTGKNPGKLGIFWWENIDWKNGEVYYPSSRTVEPKEIWDYMNEAGIRAGVLGMPTTYPPKSVKDFLIAGGEVPDSGFTYPKEIETELKQQGWRNHPQAFLELDRHQASQEIHKIIDMTFQVAKALATKYKVDFLQVTAFHINSLHHFLWDSSETRTAWEIIDKHIGELLEEGCDLMVTSDHGSNKIRRVFNINAWLKQQGYLRLRLNSGDLLYRLGITRERLLAILSRLKLVETVRKLVPERLYLEIPNLTGEVRKQAKSNKINWHKSKAFASGQGPIYLNPKNRNEDGLKDEIRQKLETLIDPITGDKIIEKVYSKDEIYSGKYLAEAPDLIVDQAKGTHIPGGIGQKSIFESPQRWQGENKKSGLFMAYGPDIEPAGGIDNVSILDLAPTILHLLGIRVPKDMDGRVLKEIFRFASEPGKREVMYQQISNETERERIRKAIKKLALMRRK